MRGRTNAMGSGEGGLNLGADVQEFVVANGSNITAGNFVQYETIEYNQKYDMNSGKKITSKVWPCGNNKYITCFTNGSQNGFWFSLIDVSNGFKVANSFIITSSYLPALCLLNDGKVAICYMEKEKTVTVNIYSIGTTLSMTGTYELSEESFGSVRTTRMTQLGNGKIAINKYNYLIVCEYNSGVVGEHRLFELGISYIPSAGGTPYFLYIHTDNDWNMYATGESSFLIFPTFEYNGNYAYFVYLIRITGTGFEVDDYHEIKISSLTLNKSVWGNAFGINGKVLFSNGGYLASGYYHESNVDTLFFYDNNGKIAETQILNLLKVAKDKAGANVPTSLSKLNGTAQYVKENVFYAAVNFSPNTVNAFIFRAEYDFVTGTFFTSNVVIADRSVTATGRFFENESGDIYYLYETDEGRYLLKMAYLNGMLEMGENTKYVENYSGSAPIGVAKESGKPGQTIEVYVPTPV